jgi:hypothetical protein
LASESGSLPLDFGAGGCGFGGDALLGFLHHFLGASAQGAEEFGAFVENGLAGGFLLGIDLGAGFLQGIVVTVHFIAGGGLRGGGFGFGAVDAAGALVHGALERAEERGAHDEEKDKDDYDRRQGLENQVFELANHFHFLQTAALLSSWIMRLIERRVRSGHKNNKLQSW